MTKHVTGKPINTRQRNNSRWILIALVLLFTIPVIGPFFWTPKSFVNRGDLIQPQARPLDALHLVDASGSEIGIDTLKGKWTMVVIDHASCDAVCQRNLYNIRQVRLTQGRHMKRVQLAWILLSGTKSDIDKEFIKDYPQLQVFTAPGQGQDEVNQLFMTQFGAPGDDLQRVYFIDPLGNLVMSFDPEQDPREIQKDLGRLLRVSKAGEKQL